MLGHFFKKPADDRQGRIPPGQSLTKRFPVLTYGPAPRYELSSATLRVWGLAQPRQLTWPQLAALPQTTLTCDIHCVTRWSKLDTTWTGVRTTDLRALLALSPQASHVMVHSVGGYSTNLSLDDFFRPQNLLAHRFDGQALDTQHGGPLRLVVPHLYFWKSAKWVSGLEFMSADAPGFWERNGYHRRGDPFNEERYDDD